MASSRDSAALVVDDHELFRVGIAAVMRGQLGFNEVIEADNLDAALYCLSRRSDFDLAVVEPDTAGVNGLFGLRLVRRLCPTLPIVVITGSCRRGQVLETLAAGIQGVVPKSSRAEQIEQAFRAVLAGRFFIPPDLPERGVPPPAELVATGGEAERSPCLTPRQRQVIRLMAQGKSNKEIARALDLAEGTIKVHVNALYRTLSVHNRAGAVAALAQQHWLQAS